MLSAKNQGVLMLDYAIIGGTVVDLYDYSVAGGTPTRTSVTVQGIPAAGVTRMVATANRVSQF